MPCPAPLQAPPESVTLKHMQREVFQLVDSTGRRLYLTKDERKRFIAAAEKQRHEIRTFCYVMAHTGCRLSEALELSSERVDLDAGTIAIRSLKKRVRKVKGKKVPPKTPFRTVPVPPDVMNTLNLVHDLRQARSDTKRRILPLWPWSRTTAWRHVQAVMKAAGIEDGPHASPKGLRHAFGVNAIASGVTLNMLQKWMGHTYMETTAIYANAIGQEERDIAARMWA